LQIYLGAIQPDIKEALDEGDVKRLAIVGDDNFILLDVPNKIIQVLSLDIWIGGRILTGCCPKLI